MWGDKKNIELRADGLIIINLQKKDKHMHKYT